MIRVLLVNDHLGWKGEILHGVGKLFLLTVPRFDRSEFSVLPCILRSKDALDRSFVEKSVQVRYLNRKKFEPATVFDLVRIIRKERIDVLHVQGYAGSTFGRLAGILTHKPVIVQSHSVDPNYPFYMHFADFALSRFTRHCLALCESVEEFCRRTRHMPRDRVSRIRLGIDVDEFRAPSDSELEEVRREFRLPTPGEGRVVGTVTRLFEQKGNRYFLEAAKRILEKAPDTVFVLVGDGPLGEELRRQAADLGIADQVRFAGFQDRVNRLLHVFDVAVVASLWEATPLAAIEALAAGRPLVSTDVDGLVEMVEDEVSALLVSPADSSSLAERILELMENRDKAQRLARDGEALAREMFTVDRYVRDLEAVYRQAAEAFR